MRVAGQWAYLYRALDKHGHTIDFYLSSRRNSAAAKRFLTKAVHGLKPRQLPQTINIDKASAYPVALVALKEQGRYSVDTKHLQVKYLNNVIECDHCKLKRIINHLLGFKSMQTVDATLKDIEITRALRKGWPLIGIAAPLWERCTS